MRRRMQVIFQDPYSSLNPRMTVGQIIGEPLAVHGIVPDAAPPGPRGCTSCCATPACCPPWPAATRTSCRAGSASASASPGRWPWSPSLIICDEPVSALDVSIQAQIINLLEELQAEFGLTYLFIAHDLSVVRHISDRVAVMYLGKIVEITDRKSLYENPLAPLYQGAALGGAHPGPGGRGGAGARSCWAGRCRARSTRPSGCVFHPRCPIAIDECQPGRPGAPGDQARAPGGLHPRL